MARRLESTAYSVQHPVLGVEIEVRPPKASHSAAVNVYRSTSNRKRESSVFSAPSQSGQRMIGVGLAVGAGIGSALGVIFGNIPIGVAAGVALGILAGFALSKRGR